MIRKLKKYQQGGSFRDQLFPENKPVVDQGNFSKVKYTPAQKAAMQNANLVRKNEEKKKLQDEIAARQSKEKGTPYKLPTGVTKKYKDMTLKERAYVDAQSLRNKGRWNENQVEQPFLNTFNPITMLYDMAAGLGEAPLMSDVTNSYMPYVTGVVAPLAVGAFAGIGAKTTGQFVNNLTNPLAGTGQIIDNIGNKYLPNAYKYNPWAFKPNSESYYRGIGRSGLDDAFDNRVLKTANKTGDYGENLYMTDNFNVAKGNYSQDQGYGIGSPFSDDWKIVQPKDPKSYIAEIPKSIVPNIRQVNNGQIFINKGSLPIKDVKFYKQDWLRGYKEVPKPKIYSKGQPTQQSILNNLNESFPKPLTSEELDRFYDKYVPKLKETSQFIQEQGIRELKDFTSEEGQRRARLALLKINPTLSETEINHLLKNQITELENAYKYNMQEYMLRRPGKWVGNTDEHIDFFNSNYPTNNAFAWRNPKFFTELTNKPGSIENNIIPRNLFVNPSTSNIPISKHYNSQTFIDGQRHLLDPNLTIPTISLGQTNKLKSTFDHETAHLLQRSGLHPTDIELQKLAKEDFFQNIWLKYKKKTMSPRDYNNSIEYFYNPSKNNPLRYFPNEGYAFAREARRSMIDKGILNDTFDKVTPFKLLKHTLTKEVNDPIVGLANNKRLTTVFPFWKWGKLSKIINNMNTVAPIIGGAGLLGAGALQQQKKGGPIITNRGQWDYPGQTTIIPSNQITMQGVPYPVLGVDNIGHSKLMQPGRNYTFPGQYVTEYPIMQKGGVLKDPTMESLSNVYAQRNRNLPWVDRALNPQNYPINNQQEFMDKGQPMTHQLNWGEDADYMKFYVYPNIGYSQGNLEWNNNQQSIEFKSKKMAEYFSKNGLIKHYQQGGSTKQNPPKEYTDYKAFKKAERLYKDSLNLYNNNLNYKNKYLDFVNKAGFDKTKVEEWPTDGYVNTEQHPTIGAISNGVLKNSGGGFRRDSKGNPIYFNYFPLKNGKELKVYTDSFVGSILNKRYYNYKKPVEPVVYKPQSSVNKSKQSVNANRTEVMKKPIIPNLSEEYQYKKWKERYGIEDEILDRLPMLPYLTEDSDITMNSGQFKVPAPVVQQPKGRPVYGPGNTIIGYNNNMHFTPALQYTGAPNNASNLQDKALLENPDALRQYVSKLDNYRFDKGGVYSQALNNTVNGLNQLSYFSKNSPDNAMRDYYMNMSNYDSNNQDLYSTNQDLYGNTYFDDGGSYEELSNEYNNLSELQSIASMDGDNELYEYLAPQISSVQKSLTSLEELAKYDVIKEELQRQILQQPQFQEPSIEGYNPRRPFTSNYESTDSEASILGTKNNPIMLGTKIYPNMKLKGSPRNVKAYLTQKGLSRNAIAGIMGNIEHESSFNPGIGGDQGTSFGLFQHHAKRKDNLLSYLKKRNLDKTSIEGQIDFALSEYPQLIQKLNKAVSPQQAADIWVREFEKPANVEKQSKLRQRAALKYMKQGGTLPFLKQYK
jgi:hypothetical protein